MSESKFVRAEQQGNVLVITPLFTYATFAEPDVATELTQVQEQVDSPDTEEVIIDLGEIPYFGSTVLEWVAQLWKRVKSKGGRLAVWRRSEMGGGVLAASRLKKLWEFFEPPDQAFSWRAKPQA